MHILRENNKVVDLITKMSYDEEECMQVVEYVPRELIGTLGQDKASDAFVHFNLI